MSAITDEHIREFVTGEVKHKLVVVDRGNFALMSRLLRIPMQDMLTMLSESERDRSPLVFLMEKE